MTDGRSWVRRLLRLDPPPSPVSAPSPVIVELRAYREESERRRREHARARDETGNLLEFVALGGPYRRDLE